MQAGARADEGEPHMKKQKYDSTVARIAGNIAAGLVENLGDYQQIDVETIAETAVMLARAIVAETLRTEPDPETER